MKIISDKMVREIVLIHITVSVLIAGIAGSLLLQRIHRYDRVIVEVGKQYALPPRLLASIIWKESRFIPDRVGAHHEIGLMQVTPGAVEDWQRAHDAQPMSRLDIAHGRTNILIGGWYLARAVDYWKQFHPDPYPMALAEYNAGRKNALRWWTEEVNEPRAFWENISYPSTKRYVRDILLKYRGRI